MHQLSQLQEAGIHAQKIEKLAQAGLTTLETVAITPKKQLVAIRGISDKDADNILTAGS
jgi:DNA repair protein RAD51